MLRTSTKNVAYEVISCLIESNGRGVLTEIIKWLTTSNQNLLNDNDSILNQLSLHHKRLGDNSDEEPESFQAPPDAVRPPAMPGQPDIRIKIRKSSVDPHSNKMIKRIKQVRQMQQQVAQGVSPKRELQSEGPRGEERSPQARGEGSPFNLLSKEAAGTQS
jgi:hypothetical protein